MALESYKKYLAMVPSEDKQVGLWIADLEKRHKNAQKVAGSKP